MNKTTFLSIAVLLVNLTITSAANTNEAERRAPTWIELANASYAGIEKGAISLSTGNWEGKPYMEGAATRPRVGLLEDVYFTGDLNGDGVDEAVVILWQSSGGTGSNSYIAVMSGQNDDVVNIGTALIGDRVKLRSWQISNAIISLDVLQVGEGDPMCCPTMLVTRSWSLNESELGEGEPIVDDALSVSALNGSNWMLTHVDWNEPIAEGIDITLTFSGDRISGKSACNRYSAGIHDGETAGRLELSQSMGTKMACPEEVMAIERQYLDVLSRVNAFSFHVGNLVFSGPGTDGGTSSLLFKPVVNSQ